MPSVWHASLPSLSGWSRGSPSGYLTARRHSVAAGRRSWSKVAEATASEVQSPALQTEHCDDVGPYWNARQFSVTTSRKSTE